MPVLKSSLGLFGKDAGSALEYDFANFGFSDSGQGSVSDSYDIGVAGADYELGVRYDLAFGLIGKAHLDLGRIDGTLSYTDDAVVSDAATVDGTVRAFVDTSASSIDESSFEVTGPDAAESYISIDMMAKVKADVFGHFGGWYDIGLDWNSGKTEFDENVVDLNIQEEVFKVTAADLGGADGELYRVDLDFAEIAAGLPVFDYDDIVADGDGPLATLTMTGTSSPFLTVEVDIDSFLLPEGNSFDYEVDLLDDTITFGIDLGILDAKLVATASFKQEITWTPDIDVTMTSSFGEELKGDLGDVFEFTTPEGEGTFKVTAVYHASVTVGTVTSLVLATAVDWKMLYGEAFVAIDVLGYQDKWGFDISLIEGSIPLGPDISFELFSDESVYTLETITREYDVAYENFVTAASGRDLKLTTHQLEVVGGDIDNVITGNALDNILSGRGGDDRLNGGGGVDTLIGGTGDDIYVVDTATDSVVELADEGSDLVVSSVDYMLGTNVENLTLAGDALHGIGNALDNVLTGSSGNNSLAGNAGNDTLDGGEGNDTLDGGVGDDVYVVDAIGDVVLEQADAGTDTVRSTLTTYTLGANIENLIFGGAGAFTGSGNAAANSVTGGAGNDMLDGKAGADTLVGHGGDDTYVVDNVGDVVVEATGEGTDRIVASVDYTLAANVEDLLLAVGATTGTGNDLDNRLTGNAAANMLRGAGGNDYLDGGSGNDTLFGGSGDDSYVVDAAGDVITELGDEGTDLVLSNIASYTLSANVENLTLIGVKAVTGTGNALDNVLIGNAAKNTLRGEAGDDYLDGQGGNDALIGGDGNDVYVVDSLGDTVTERSNAGTDTIETALATYTLKANVENLVYTGTGNFTGTGTSANNLISGGQNHDYLNGGDGLDTMIGYDGNDTYVVSRAEDIVIEAVNGGIDEVLSAAGNYLLATNVENLRQIGNARNATGNALANVIVGNGGANILDGGAGADELRGGSGKDTFVFRAGETVAGDRVADFSGAGAASGDKLLFLGFGSGATIAQVGLSDYYTIQSATHQAVTIQLMGVYNLNTGTGSNDYLFG
ncbi:MULTISPECIES: beta strand repeat-containing protein [unclassified Sphingomonas]|uniref:beta strand repeat-containing protein n=1 Tax=unclassified Sphingomonas TaxID=196159 RepID=UPI000AEE0E29|nr:MULTISPECIES: calcium-binding protein [unclassified Sphingomonas]